MIVFNANRQKRKYILTNICKENKQWKWRILVSIFLFVISLAMMVATFVMLVVQHADSSTVFAFVCAGLCMACIPFFFGLTIIKRSKYECGLPYSGYANGSLLLYQDSLEYVFWQVGPHEPSAYSSKRAVYRDEDKYIYRIFCNDVKLISFNGDICTICGKASIILPLWAIDGCIKEKILDEFSFALAFEHNNTKQIISEWREKNVKS